MDLNKKTLTFTCITDIEQQAHYNLTGKVLLLPVFGDGESVIKFSECAIIFISGICNSYFVKEVIDLLDELFGGNRESKQHELTSLYIHFHFITLVSTLFTAF